MTPPTHTLHTRFSVTTGEHPGGDRPSEDRIHQAPLHLRLRAGLVTWHSEAATPQRADATDLIREWSVSSVLLLGKCWGACRRKGDTARLSGCTRAERPGNLACSRQSAARHEAQHGEAENGPGERPAEGVSQLLEGGAAPVVCAERQGELGDPRAAVGVLVPPM